VRADGITPPELDKAQKQLRARLVFENDSVTNIAHQIGFFETIASASTIFGMADRISRVTADEVGRAAAECLRLANRTVGWFDPS